MNPLNPVGKPCEKGAGAPQGKENSPRGRGVCQEKMLGPIAAACLSWAGFTGSSARAEDWRCGEFEYIREPHHFCPLCGYGIRARGSAYVALFDGASKCVRPKRGRSTTGNSRRRVCSARATRLGYG